MKNAIRLMPATMLLLCLFISTALPANPIVVENTGLIIKVAPSEKGRAIELRMANLQGQLTKVKILDIWGFGLLSQTVDKEDGYSSLLNLKDLPSGDYILRIEHPSGVLHHAFRLGIETVTFFDSFGENEGFVKLAATATDQIPSVRFSNEKNALGIQVHGADGGQVQVHVCNMAGKIYFKEKFKSVQALNERFSTEKLPVGEFMLVVRADDKTFIQPFLKSGNGLKLGQTLFSKPLQTGGTDIYSMK